MKIVQSCGLDRECLDQRPAAYTIRAATFFASENCRRDAQQVRLESSPGPEPEGGDGNGYFVAVAYQTRKLFCLMSFSCLLAARLLTDWVMNACGPSAMCFSWICL